ncbi:MAG TPA: acetyl ornithine aminotransferase family protein [Bryobacteraceae bacterium]|nr:acetyl ornithine aminotransferase family protein [Bryobacteraceae bacterium]HPT26516.1 acetyl ornithine aminotransferase family protein [Bryobacteraceae bacterium]
MSNNSGHRSDLPHIITSLPGPNAKDVIARDRGVISPSYTRGYPLVIARGEGAVVEDVDGNRFLDMNAGIAVVSTGHCHPHVVEAIREQAGKFIHMSGTDFYYENMVEFAEKLAALAGPPGSRRVYFGNSGAEAIEAALKLARYHTGRDKFVAFLGGFHGRTMGALSLTGSKAVQKQGFAPLLSGVTHIPYAYCYRCAYSKQPDTCNVECVKVLEETLFKTILPADEVAAIFVEPVQGEGGYVVPPQKFFDELQAVTRRHGILLVCDEVQSGMGRTGRMFAHQHFGFDPDIFALAKGIASGMPLGATVAKAEFMQWKPGAHASTFGGNPVSIAAGLATLELLEKELVENAATLGAQMKARMESWPARFPIVGDVRGLGLMLGIEIVKDQATKERAPELRDAIVETAFERGVLVLGAGQNTIRLSPPLVLTGEQADYALTVLEVLLAGLCR